MPYSFGFYKDEIAKHILNNVPRDAKILDVGAGSGTYGMMLNAFYHIDALEIFEDYIKEFKLHEIYQNIHIGDIKKFIFTQYDYLIIGDVLEHLSIPDAKYLLAKINHHKKKCIVAVPYQMKQGVVNNNIHEVHWQEDLTPEIMAFRYPSLKLLMGNQEYGYYINY